MDIVTEITCMERYNKDGTIDKLKVEGNKAFAHILHVNETSSGVVNNYKAMNYWIGLQDTIKSFEKEGYEVCK